MLGFDSQRGDIDQITITPVKSVVQVKLMPEGDQASALSASLDAVNESANWVSGIAFERGVPREYELRKHTYAELKQRGLGAQAAQHTIKKVRDAFRLEPRAPVRPLPHNSARGQTAPPVREAETGRAP